MTASSNTGWSGRRDLNPRPLGPEPSALAKLCYVPDPTACDQLLNHTFLRARKNSITPGMIDRITIVNSTIAKLFFTHGSPPNHTPPRMKIATHNTPPMTLYARNFP